MVVLCVFVLCMGWEETALFLLSVFLSCLSVCLSFFLSCLSVLSSQYPAMGYGLGVVCSCVIAITDDILYEIPTWNICTVVIAVILV